MDNKLTINYLQETDIINYVNNSRTHSDEQISQLKASIAEFGMNTPIGLHKGVIVYGHARFRAMKELGYTEFPTVDLSHLTDAQRKAFVIADNRLALNADWDNELLKVELNGLDDLGFNLDLLGFDDDEIKELMLGISEVSFPVLADGDKKPFQQVTFTLHDEQKQIIDDALMMAKTTGLIDAGLNENSNGNAISFICEQWLNVKNYS